LISGDDIIIDAKSGTTGAGRASKEAFLYCEVTDGMHAYGVASHRHSPEIEQGLTDAYGDIYIIKIFNIKFFLFNFFFKF
jgi:N-acetyl-gamma-glutamyl-phosphate reductase